MLSLLVLCSTIPDLPHCSVFDLPDDDDDGGSGVVMDVEFEVVVDVGSEVLIDVEFEVLDVEFEMPDVDGDSAVLSP